MQRMDREPSSPSATAALVCRPGVQPDLAVCRYHINKNLTLEANEYGWDANANIVFVDQVCCAAVTSAGVLHRARLTGKARD